MRSFFMKILSVALCVVLGALLLPAAAMAAAPAEAGVEVMVDGRPVVWTDVKPLIDSNDRTLVPLRAVAEAMGLGVSWDQSTRTASFSCIETTEYGDEYQRVLNFGIGARTAYGVRDIPTPPDGRLWHYEDPIQMDTAAVIIDDRTYAPIRYLAEYFGYLVDWNGASRTVYLLSPMYLSAPYYAGAAEKPTGSGSVEVLLLRFDPFTGYEDVASISFVSASADGVPTDAEGGAGPLPHGAVYGLAVVLPKGEAATDKVEITLRLLLKDGTEQTRTWRVDVPHFPMAV